MPKEPQVCFRCTEEFRDRFISTARARGTRAQRVLEQFAREWLEEGSTTGKSSGGLTDVLQTDNISRHVPSPARPEYTAKQQEAIDKLIYLMDSPAWKALGANLDFFHEACVALKSHGHLGISKAEHERAVRTRAAKRMESLSRKGRGGGGNAS